jgi:hypothetical protein
MRTPHHARSKVAENAPPRNGCGIVTPPFRFGSAAAARAALARNPVPLLVPAEGLLEALGPAVARAMLEQAGAWGTAPLAADCGANAGLALQALRAGFPLVWLDPARPAFAQVAAAAAEIGARCVPPP